MDQPDAILSFQAKSKTWLIEANEGDSRGYTGYNEEVRGRTLRLGAGDTDKDGDFDELYVLGGRSFSIWDMTGDLVYDRGDTL